MKLNALGLFIGLVLVHNGRRIRLAEDLGDWVLRFEDIETGHDYVLQDEATGKLLNPTIPWLFEEKEAGRLADPDADADMEGRRRTFLGLDKAACIKRDPKSAMRFRWAHAVIIDGPDTTSDASYAGWIATRPDLIPDEQGQDEDVPTAPSLRRWVRKLKAAGGRRGVLVSCAGRLKGQSQLKGLEDWLVQLGAVYLWSAEDAKIIDAAAYYHLSRQQILEGNDEEMKSKLGKTEARMIASSVSEPGGSRMPARRDWCARRCPASSGASSAARRRGASSPCRRCARRPIFGRPSSGRCVPISRCNAFPASNGFGRSSTSVWSRRSTIDTGPAYRSAVSPVGCCFPIMRWSR